MHPGLLAPLNSTAHRRFNRRPGQCTPRVAVRPLALSANSEHLLPACLFILSLDLLRQTCTQCVNCHPIGAFDEEFRTCRRTLDAWNSHRRQLSAAKREAQGRMVPSHAATAAYPVADAPAANTLRLFPVTATLHAHGSTPFSPPSELRTTLAASRRLGHQVSGVRPSAGVATAVRPLSDRCTAVAARERMAAWDAGALLGYI